MGVHALSVNHETFAIVADIGGTHARFCRVNLSNLVMDNVAVYCCAEFSSVAKALMHYQQCHGLTTIRQVALAIACPVIDDAINMTNFHWKFSIKSMKAALKLTAFQVINDFTAIAMSLSLLSGHDKIQIGSAESDLNKPMVVLGAGTGLGVACVIPTESGFIPLPGEGGHASFAAQTEQEWFIQRFLADRYGHVSPERLLSGAGLTNLYLALASYKKLQVMPLAAADIAQLALTGQSLLAKDAVAQFFVSLGSFAGDLALTYGALGGVYIAGGIVPKLLPLMNHAEFRKCFEDKGRFQAFNRQIASFIVVAQQPGLLGAAAYLKQKIKEYDGI